jgi:hypothetical protein
VKEYFPCTGALPVGTPADQGAVRAAGGPCLGELNSHGYSLRSRIKNRNHSWNYEKNNRLLFPDHDGRQSSDLRIGFLVQSDHREELDAARFFTACVITLGAALCAEIELKKKGELIGYLMLFVGTEVFAVTSIRSDCEMRTQE